MRDMKDHCGPLVTSTDITVRLLNPAVALVPDYSPLVGLPERLLGGLRGPHSMCKQRCISFVKLFL